MKRILAAVIAAIAVSNVAFAQGSNDATTQRDQRQAYDFLVKYSPL